MTARHSVILASVPLLLLFGATSCGKRAAKPDTAAARDQTISPTPAAKTNTAPDLRAAAEPFELVTEAAFGTTAPLDAAVQRAEATAPSARALLPDSAKALFDAHLAALDTAHAKIARADVALSSIEIFRDLVSAGPGSAKHPLQVSLLDYAGYRYDADLKAAPERWADMSKAAGFADATWTVLATRIADTVLTGKMGAELAAMKQAAAAHDSTVAARSVKAELDLVDQLETYFIPHKV